MNLVKKQTLNKMTKNSTKRSPKKTSVKKAPTLAKRSPKKTSAKKEPTPTPTPTGRPQRGAKELAIALRTGMGIKVPSASFRAWAELNRQRIAKYGTVNFQKYLRLVFLLTALVFSAWTLFKISVKTLDWMSIYFGTLIDQFWEKIDSNSTYGDFLRQLPLPETIVREKSMSNKLKAMFPSAVSFGLDLTYRTALAFGLTLSWIVTNPVTTGVYGLMLYASPKPIWIEKRYNKKIDNYISQHSPEVFKYIYGYLPKGGVLGKLIDTSTVPAGLVYAMASMFMSGIATQAQLYHENSINEIWRNSQEVKDADEVHRILHDKIMTGPPLELDLDDVLEYNDFSASW